MTITVQVRGSFGAWLTGRQEAMRKATATALARTAFAVRTEITKEIPSIFNETNAMTRRSVLYQMQGADKAINEMQARLYIRDASPDARRWLGPEIAGGLRADKRSEMRLKAAGLMLAGQQSAPAGGFRLKGSEAVRVLSQLKAFDEQGFNANMTEKTKKRLLRKGKTTLRRTGAEFFVARDKRSGEPYAIYQLVGRGEVRAVLHFVDHRPHYRAKFRFTELVTEKASRQAQIQFAKAFAEAMR